MTVAQCYTPKGNKITGKALEPQIAGTKPEGKAPPQEADKPLPPDQDPWVRQALEILKKGKTPQIAKHKNLE
jgi:hypothetical protein